MSIYHGLLRPALILFGMVLATGGAISSRGADLKSGLADSPFGPTVVVSTTIPAGVEFRGIVREGEVWLVNLYHPGTKKSHWVPVGGEAAGFTVKSYDEVTGRLSVLQNGKPMSLALKQSRVVLQGNNTPLKLLGPAERVTEAEAPNLPAHLRDLPPEARKLLEEARRRQAIRWPAMATEDAAPVARP